MESFIDNDDPLATFLEGAPLVFLMLNTANFVEVMGTATETPVIGTGRARSIMRPDRTGLRGAVRASRRAYKSSYL